MSLSLKYHFALIGLSSFLFSPSLCFGQVSVVTTPIYGFCTITAPAGGSVVAPVFVQNSIYSGVVSISGSTFLAAGITANALAPTSYTDRPNTPRYYVEITSGTYAGYTSDVESNDANGITVYGLPNVLNGQSGVTIAVRPHFTLGDMTNVSSGLSALTDTFTLYQGKNAQSSYYYSGGGVVGGDYTTPSGQIVVYPGSGVLLNNSGNASFTFSGLVKTNQTVVPVYSGINLLAPLDPSGTTVMTSENLTSGLQPYIDSVSLVANDGTLVTKPFYSDGSQLLDQNYAPVNPVSAPIVTSGNGFFVNALQNSLWVNLSALSSY